MYLPHKRLVFPASSCKEQSEEGRQELVLETDWMGGTAMGGTAMGGTAMPFVAYII
jgi:hypothetical protein